MTTCSRMGVHLGYSHISNKILSDYGCTWYFRQTGDSFLLHMHSLAKPENYKFSKRLTLKMVKLL